ncbi:Translationally-controlled tumor protein like protein [Tritrichomonas foetus]|uniref:Translationally-controlled tumor protein like protein n=1 Tax=Tritrichomonas foetus TaxID=1144522 RepID=A0A1J4K6X9_9EUKA|nr:Translationally-controlled tumor protein like protein [Tritrichomonas foetus]|eukprot:OHT06730.1 Translationally-controlled tumor protein like protein [Tritrichomonas foetus]
MRLYECPFTNDELISDAYPHKLREDIGCLEFESRYVEKLADEEDPNSKYQVLDIVENFGLQEFEMKKAAFMGWVKSYMPKRKGQLEQNNPSIVADFMKDAKAFATYIATNWSNISVYMGKSGDPDSMLLFAEERDGKTYFLLLEKGADNFKC